MPDHVIGVDIGTTATKAVVFDLRGRVVAHRTVEYPLLTPTPATAELNAGSAVPPAPMPEPVAEPARQLADLGR